MPTAIRHTCSVAHTQCPSISCPLCLQSASHVGDAHTCTHTQSSAAMGKPRGSRVVRKGFLEAEASKLRLEEGKSQGEFSRQQEEHVQRPSSGREHMALEEPNEVCGTGVSTGE